MLDTVTLSRIQFAFTISFHILFPAFSIGLTTFLAVMEGIWLKTKNPKYLQICKFWTKVFALTFGMGVVSGIVMEFQFGTNWAGFTHAVGAVLGALFTYEVMTAFFIEAGFLGVMLFGWNRVGPKLHYFATLLVTVGTTLSAYWIMSANTWMQHPVGYREIAGTFRAVDWPAIVFNPATYPRFAHMMLAAYISASFVIVSISAYYLLKNKHVEFAKTCFSFVWGALLLLIPLQLYVGDMSGTRVFKDQPIKTAAMEGVWNTQKGAPFVVFAIPDKDQQKNLYAITIPHMASVLNTRHWNGEMRGLKTVAKEDQPPVAIVFFAFRIMVGLGLLMLLLTLIAFYLRRKKRLLSTQWFLKASVMSAPLGFLALWCGWITAEEGRQPWVVYNILRTSDASSLVNPHDVFISLILIIIVYGIIFGFFYFFFLHKMIKKGPAGLEETEVLDQPFQYMSASTSEEPNNGE